MDVLQIIPHFPPEPFLIEHIKAISAQANQLKVSWYYLSSPQYGNFNHIGPPLAREIGAFRKNHFSLTHRIKKKLRSLTLDEYCKYYNINQLIKLNPDLIHFQFGWSLDSYSWILDTIKAPYCVSFRGSDILVEPDIDDSYIHRMKPFVKGAVGIHVVSESVKQRVIELFAPDCHVEVIYTPIACDWISNTSTDQSSDIVAIGRLHWIKDYQELFQAFKIFSKNHPNVRLKVIGDGPDRVKLTFLAKKLEIDSKVIFLGKLDKNQIGAELKTAKIMVITSLSEGFPNTLLESLLSGVNCIVPNTLGLDSVFRNGEILTYKKFDIPDLARVLTNQYHEDGSISKERINKAVELVSNIFSFEEHSNRFNRFYQNLLR